MIPINLFLLSSYSQSKIIYYMLCNIKAFKTNLLIKSAIKHANNKIRELTSFVGWRDKSVIP